MITTTDSVTALTLPVAPTAGPLDSSLLSDTSSQQQLSVQAPAVLEPQINKANAQKSLIRAQSSDRIKDTDTKIKMVSNSFNRGRNSVSLTDIKNKVYIDLTEQTSAEAPKMCFKLKKVIGKGTYSTVYLTAGVAASASGVADAALKSTSDVVSQISEVL